MQTKQHKGQTPALSAQCNAACCRVYRVVLQSADYIKIVIEHMAEVQREQDKGGSQARSSSGHRAQLVSLLRLFVCFLCLFVCLFFVSQELQALQCKGSGVN